jgi:hemerythrin-like metal-binding protein
MAIVWRETLSLHVPNLDQQHKSIINTFSVLEKACDTKNFELVDKLVDTLLPYFNRHFKEEEAYFEEIQYAQRDWHKKVHGELRHRAEDLVGRYRIAADDDARLTIANDLGTFFADYLFDHIVKEDMKVKAAGRVDTSAPVSVVVLHEKGADEQRRRKEERNKDIEYSLPPHLAHLLTRLEYDVPDLPPPQGGYATFQMLCEGAIERRLDKVLIFFQRRNRQLERELPPFFLSSPKFREKLYAALRRLVLPELWASRQVRALSASVDISRIDNESFWDLISDTLRLYLMDCWRMTWEHLKPVSVRKEDGGQVFKVKDQLKLLREMLQPDDPADYDLPKIGAHELDLFSSLLDLQTDWWGKLNRSWQVFLDLYEQEKDPRMFQQRVREGALRDYMLESFNSYPIEWLDFILLAAHSVFPRITTGFLDSFTTNYPYREKVLPFTMRYIGLVKQVPEISQRELREEEAYKEQRAELRKVLTGRGSQG